MNEKIKELKSKKFKIKISKMYLIIFIMTCTIFLYYINNGLLQGDDYICHISNLIAIDEYISIKDLRFFPTKINPVMANNFGYGNAIFYPQLSYICTIIIYSIGKQIGLSLINSIKLFLFLVVLLSRIYDV